MYYEYDELSGGQIRTTERFDTNKCKCSVIIRNELGNYESYGNESAFKLYFLDSNIIMKEVYYKNGKYHRDNFLPAFIEYDICGNVTGTSYYIDGKSKSLEDIILLKRKEIINKLDI